MTKENVSSMQDTLKKAENNAKKRDFAKDADVREKASELKKSVLDELKETTGKDFYIAEVRDPFAGEPFSQVIHRNLDTLTQIGYLTDAEKAFLFSVQAYIEFKSNVIICREDKFKKKPRGKNIDEAEDFILPKAATVNDIAKMLKKSRVQTSNIMNALKKKDILLNPEGAGQVTENGRTVSPRTWIINPYIIICAPRKNKVNLDTLTMRLFQHSLKDLTDKNGKKVNLPARFF